MTFNFTEPSALIAFEQSFDIQSSDGGYKSLQIVGFELISTNRELDKNTFSYLRDDDLDIDATESIIMNKGLAARVDAELIDDCNDYTFCRLVKENFVYSRLLFEGTIGKTVTKLASPIDNFNLRTGVSFADANIILNIHKAEEGSVKMTLEGDLATVTEEDRAAALNGVWDFGDSPDSDIKIIASMKGIYDNVFKVGLIDYSNIKANATIYNQGDISNFELKGLGLIGHECYNETFLITNLQDEDNDEPDTIVDLSQKESAQGVAIPVISGKCKSAYLTFEFDHENIDNNLVRGAVSFTNPEDVIRTTLDLKSDDVVPSIINRVEFPFGLILKYSYRDSKEDLPMTFTGEMDFMGVRTHGQFDLYFWNYTALVNMELPTITIGGGNFQFITHSDLFYHYGIDEDQDEDDFDSRRLEVLSDIEDIKEPSSLNFKLEKETLKNSRLLMEANILLFDMVKRIAIYLDTDILSFSLSGSPFRGIFESDNTVQVLSVDDIENEDNSVLKMVLKKNEKLQELEDLTNHYLHIWVSRIIQTTELATILEGKLQQDLENMSQTYIPIDECEIYEQCEDLPSIICDEYAQTAECKEEKDVCVKMIQK